MRAPAIRAVMERRLLVNYRVDPELLAALLPAPFRPVLVAGYGVAGICLIRLGYRRELDAIADAAERQQRYDQLVASYYERGKALSTAAAFEIDDVIDPADTRAILISALAGAGR